MSGAGFPLTWNWFLFRMRFWIRNSIWFHIYRLSRQDLLLIMNLITFIIRHRISNSIATFISLAELFIFRLEFQSFEILKFSIFFVFSWNMLIMFVIMSTLRLWLGESWWTARAIFFSVLKLIELRRLMSWTVVLLLVPNLYVLLILLLKLINSFKY